jgi:mRNA interferase MazF
MEKDFDAWNNIKKRLDQKDKKFFFKEGEIWWMSVGLNIANESCGKGESFRRPVLVVKKLSGNSFIGLPLSSKEKVGSWFTDVTINGEKRYVLLYQIRMWSTNRFESRLTTLEDKDFDLVKEKLERLLKLYKSSPRKAGISG